MDRNHRALVPEETPPIEDRQRSARHEAVASITVLSQQTLARRNPCPRPTYRASVRHRHALNRQSLLGSEASSQVRV